MVLEMPNILNGRGERYAQAMEAAARQRQQTYDDG